MSKHRYILFNKPYGVLCQFTDAAGRDTLKGFIDIGGVYPAGRLDRDSEGLVFLTDDGRLNSLLSDPRHGKIKTYLAQVENVPSEEQLASLRKGVVIKGYRTLPAEVKVLKQEPKLWERQVPVRSRKSVPTAWLEIKISEGKNRQVRRMTAAVGLPCLRLVRTAIGPMDIGDLKPGEYKELKNFKYISK